MTYEFTDEENADFSSLSNRMITLSIVIILGGISTWVEFFLSDGVIADLLSAALYVMMGYTLFLPVDNFKKIVTTQGNDIKELMIGFKELDKWMLYVNIITALLVIVLLVRIFVI